MATILINQFVRNRIARAALEALIGESVDRATLEARVAEILAVPGIGNKTYQKMLDELLILEREDNMKKNIILEEEARNALLKEGIEAAAKAFLDRKANTPREDYKKLAASLFAPKEEGKEDDMKTTIKKGWVAPECLTGDELKAWAMEQMDEVITSKPKRKRLYFNRENSNETIAIPCMGFGFVRYIDEDGVEHIVTENNVHFQKEMPVLKVVPNCVAHIPKHGPIADLVQSGKLQVFAFLENGEDSKLDLYKLLQLKLFLQDTKNGVPVRFVTYNHKKKHSYAIGGTREEWKNWLGWEVLELTDNPFKLAAYTLGGSGYSFNSTRSTSDELLIAITGPQEYIPGTGVKVHDGCIVLNEEVVVLLVEEGIGENRYHPSGAGQVRNIYQALLKGKICLDSDLHYRHLKRSGLEGYYGIVDGSMSLSVVKSFSNDWKAGDIMRLKVDNKGGFRIILSPTSDGQSSVGIQSCVLEHTLTEKIYEELHALEMAATLKKALEGDARAYKHVLEVSDADETLGSALDEVVKNCCFAIKDDNMPSGFRVPFYESAYKAVLVRGNSYYTRQLLKRLACKVGLKVQDDPMLDEMEREHFKKTGEDVNFVRLPKKASGKVKKALAAKKFLNVGRDPQVGEQSCQGVIVLKDNPNPTSDTIYISCTFLANLYGDVDGDGVKIIPVDSGAYGVVRVSVSEAKPYKSKFVAEIPEVSDLDIFCKMIETHETIAQAAVDTGMIDLACRAIVIGNKLKGIEISHEVSARMAEEREAKIQGMKHGDAGKSAVSELKGAKGFIKEFWIHPEPLPQGRLASREFRLLNRTAGLPRGTSTARVMQEFINLLQDPKPYCQTVPQHKIFEILQGVKSSVRHNDSKILKEEFKRQWEALAPHLKAGGYSYSDDVGIVTKVELGFNLSLINQLVKDCNDSYRLAAGQARKLPTDEARTKAFSAIKKAILAYLKTNEPSVDGGGSWLEDKWGFTRLDIYYRAVALKMGVEGFGATMSSKRLDVDGNPSMVSFGGYCFWYMPVKTLLEIARRMNPDNPFTLSTIFHIDEILAKQEVSIMKAEARRASKKIGSSEKA